MYAHNIIIYMHLYSPLWSYKNKFGSDFPLISFTFADKVFYLFLKPSLTLCKTYMKKIREQKVVTHIKLSHETKMDG